MKYQVTSAVADVRGTPDADALRGKFETQLVYGEIFIAEEEKNGWCKGVTAHDGYAGYIKKQHLMPHETAATHLVTAARSHIYSDATIKSARVDTLSFGSRIIVTGADKNFAQLDTGEWIYQKHISDATVIEKDYIATAKKFLETPYYWGGRSGFGIDCSGLVQIALALAGINVLRDTEQQQDIVGTKVDKPLAGDIVYFPGHVGFMADDKTLLHANAFHMKTVMEPLDDVIKRGSAITAIRRL